METSTPRPKKEWEGMSGRVGLVTCTFLDNGLKVEMKERSCVASVSTHHSSPNASVEKHHDFMAKEFSHAYLKMEMMMLSGCWPG